MAIFVLLALLMAIAALEIAAIRYGADSRDWRR